MTRCIMAVNDDGEFLDMLDALLPQEGYHLARCATTQSPTTTIEHVKPDLILLDCGYGVEARSWSLLQQVKLNPATAEIPVVVCSTSQTANAPTTDDIQPVAVLYKPYTLCELLSTIRTALA